VVAELHEDISIDSIIERTDGEPLHPPVHFSYLDPLGKERFEESYFTPIDTDLDRVRIIKDDLEASK